MGWTGASGRDASGAVSSSAWCAWASPRATRAAAAVRWVAARLSPDRDRPRHGGLHQEVGAG